MSSVPLSTTARKNIEAIAQMEQELLGRRSTAEKVGNSITRFFGSLWFIAAHVLFFAIWILMNVRGTTSIEPFDAYPFPFLGVVVGIEFIFLTTFVLLNQNLQARRQEHWGHLNLQVCLLAEQEITKNMQMLHMICRHLELETPTADEEVRDMAQPTPVTTLVREIERARETDEAGPGEI